MEKFDKSLKKAIEKSFPNIEKLFSEAMLSEFISTSVDDLEKFNFGLGTMIRLKLLRPKSVLYRKFVQYGFTDKEVITMMILRGFHQYALDKSKF